MSQQDQCPTTTKGEKKQASKAERKHTPRSLSTIAGKKSWRSVDEVADTQEFRDFVEREFPAGVTELFTSSRRSFLQFMGASLALAGAATIPGCRRPAEKILPYSKDVPEDVIIGKPLFYATAMALPGGGAEGLLVETHEGRPTRVEGNPLHPINHGKSSPWAQAYVLGLYDPDRLKFPVYKNPARGPLEATWEDFAAKWSELAPALGKGAGLAILVDKKSSPTRDSVKADLKKKLPEATWIAYDMSANFSAIEGSRLAFGKPMREVHSLSKAKVVVSMDRDFVATSGSGAEACGLVNARDFSAGRNLTSTKDEMNRLYMIESGTSLAGSLADHRLRLAPSAITSFAFALANKIGELTGDGNLKKLMKNPSGDAKLDAAFIDAAAEDLVAHRGACVVMAGASQSAEVHALVHAINAALGNAGKTVAYRPMSEDESSDCRADLAALAAKMNKGQISTLICLGVNPCYDAPADLNFKDLFAKVSNTITWSVEATETAAHSVWSINGTHGLEAWGDIEAADGTRSVIQPMIAPLYSKLEDASGPAVPVLSEIEFLAFVGGDAKPDGMTLIRKTWRTALGETETADKTWRRLLRDGRTQTPVNPAAAVAIKVDAVAAAIAKMAVPKAATSTSLDVVFEVGQVGDGRFGNNPWLHELPQNGTRVVWDNPALLSPKTAEALGIAPVSFVEEHANRIYTDRKYPQARMAEITLDGRKLAIAAWICPGMADNTIILTMGYGRKGCGVVGEGVGFNISGVRSSMMARTAQGATAAATAETYEISSTQNHWSMEGRTELVRQVDLAAWQKHGDTVHALKDSIYGRNVSQLNFGEMLGELSHAPPNVSLFDNPYNNGPANPDPSKLAPNHHALANKETGPQYTQGQQWGMTIDLSSCTGCGTCTIACQSENNIPVVGKIEVAKGREMTWIRVDRYYTGDDINSPESMLHQPVACVHCENAPCETVCPVNATVHGPEGMNYQVYNRCIGTRYCANNCPYKVRRYNFYEFGISKFNGGYHGKEQLDSLLKPVGGLPNVNAIPPRLREKVDEISRMQRNPDVTVRMRGVMEKCSYCVQRINASRAEMKLENLEKIPDGFFQTACQQACPSNAIVFGDILDPESKVKKTRESGRSYLLLGFLNTRPRTSYLVSVKNPNPKLRVPNADPFQVHGGGEHAPAEHGHEEKKHGFYVDPRKQNGDAGYALSLSVLS